MRRSPGGTLLKPRVCRNVVNGLHRKTGSHGEIKTVLALLLATHRAQKIHCFQCAMTLPGYSGALQCALCLRYVPATIGLEWMAGFKMHGFDITILKFLNQFAGRSPLFDKGVCFIADTPLQGAAIIAVMWWLWFRKDAQRDRNRALILSGLAMTFLALFVSRGLADLLPFRERPVWAPSLCLRASFGQSHQLINWSSFPSDHAVLFFALATVIFLISRKIGTLAYLLVFFFNCLPRIYTGTHYPTDVLAGAVLGTGMACLTLIKDIREALTRGPLRWLENSPGQFYACFFIMSFLFSTQFEPIRTAATGVWKLFAGVTLSQISH
jgi:membrane-associated phospholipid phosphatase